MVSNRNSDLDRHPGPRFGRIEDGKWTRLAVLHQYDVGLFECGHVIAAVSDAKRKQNQPRLGLKGRLGVVRERIAERTDESGRAATGGRWWLAAKNGSSFGLKDDADRTFISWDSLYEWRSSRRAPLLIVHQNVVSVRLDNRT